MDYHYFYFKPIPLEMVKWKLDQKFEFNFIKQGYSAWCGWFSRHSSLFLHHQQSYHRELLFGQFIRKNDLSEYSELWSESDNEEYDEFINDNGYLENQDKTDAHEKLVNELLSPHWKRTSISWKAMSRQRLEEFLSPELSPESLINEITRLWFNNTIDNPPKIQEKLAKMDYKDYLKTEHWRKVKALKVFIHRARCTNIKGSCHLMNEGLWGSWISDMDCHHISYKNRGNERYEDVCLLCKQCHQDFHAGKDPNIVSHINTYVRF